MAIKQHPLGMHKKAPLAAEAVLAAHDQGKFKEMHEFILKNRKALGRTMLENQARQLGLDMDKFNAALDTNAHRDQIKEETRQALSLQARGTPASFINGLYLRGARPFEAFKEIIEAELEKAKPKK